MSVAVGKLGILGGEGICQSPVMDVQFSVTDSLQMIVEYAHVHGCTVVRTDGSKIRVSVIHLLGQCWDLETHWSYADLCMHQRLTFRAGTSTRDMMSFPDHCYLG